MPALEHLHFTCGFGAGESLEQLECFVGRQRVADVAKVDAAHQLSRTHVHQQFPQWLALELRPQVPNGIDDRSGRQVHRALLRADPAQLRIAGDVTVKRAHVGSELGNVAPDQQRLQGSDGRDHDLLTAPNRERQPVTGFGAIRVQNHVRCAVIRVGIHRVRAVEQARSRKANVSHLEGLNCRHASHYRTFFRGLQRFAVAGRLLSRPTTKWLSLAV